MIISNNLSFENSLSERDINFPTQLIKGTTPIILEQMKDLITWARRRSIDSIGTDGWLYVDSFIILHTMLLIYWEKMTWGD
jgi:hypothetical protein